MKIYFGGIYHEERDRPPRLAAVIPKDSQFSREISNYT
jgi:hypothetical protein